MHATRWMLFLLVMVTSNGLFTAPSAAAPSREVPISFRQVSDNSVSELTSSPTTKRTTDQPLALPSKRTNSAKLGGGTAADKPTSSIPLTTIASSLAFVVGVFLLLILITKKAMPKSAAPLPSEVLEVLGRAPLGPRQQMQLVRIGNKLVLLSVTATGAEPLTEITEPDEVERLTALSQQARPGSVTANFRQVLHQLGTERTEPGFLGDSRRNDLELANTSSGRRRRLREENDV